MMDGKILFCVVFLTFSNSLFRKWAKSAASLEISLGLSSMGMSVCLSFATSPWVLMLKSIFLDFGKKNFWATKYSINFLKINSMFIYFISLFIFSLEFEIYKFKVMCTNVHLAPRHAWHHQQLISWENKYFYEKNDSTFDLHLK